MLFVCFLVIFDSFSVEPQEIPLPDTFINPAFQVAHHLWLVNLSSNYFNFLKSWGKWYHLRHCSQYIEVLLSQ